MTGSDRILVGVKVHSSIRWQNPHLYHPSIERRKAPQKETFSPRASYFRCRILCRVVTRIWGVLGWIGFASNGSLFILEPTVAPDNRKSNSDFKTVVFKSDMRPKSMDLEIGRKSPINMNRPWPLSHHLVSTSDSIRPPQWPRLFDRSHLVWLVPPSRFFAVPLFLLCRIVLRSIRYPRGAKRKRELTFF